MKTTFYNFHSCDLTKLKNNSKNIFFKSSLEFVSSQFQANETIKQEYAPALGCVILENV